MNSRHDDRCSGEKGDGHGNEAESHLCPPEANSARVSMPRGQRSGRSEARRAIPGIARCRMRSAGSPMSAARMVGMKRRVSELESQLARMARESSSSTRSPCG